MIFKVGDKVIDKKRKLSGLVADPKIVCNANRIDFFKKQGRTVYVEFEWIKNDGPDNTPTTHLDDDWYYPDGKNSEGLWVLIKSDFLYRIEWCWRKYPVLTSIIIFLVGKVIDVGVGIVVAYISHK